MQEDARECKRIREDARESKLAVYWVEIMLVLNGQLPSYPLPSKQRVRHHRLHLR
jgi:hypothetical protein